MFKAFFRPALVLAAGLAFSGCSAPFLPLAERPARSAVLDETKIFALLPQDIAQSALLQAAEADGYVLLDRERLKGLDLDLLTFEMPEGVSGKQAIAFLEEAEPASTVGVNHAFHPVQSAGSPHAHHGDAQMNWPAGGCKAQGAVGMIDTGVDQAVLESMGARVVSRAFHAGTLAEVQHGTDVATVLADPRHLSDVTIYSAAVVRLTEDGEATAGSDAIVRAINWLEASDVTLVNISLAGPYNKLVNRAVEAAGERGIRIVAAVGNDGPGAEPLYPAAFPDAIGVTAVDAKGRVFRRANRGEQVDVAAPGVDVWVESGETARFVTGTSIAAPFVTARILADETLMQTATTEALRGALETGAADLGRPGKDRTYGAGVPRFAGACAMAIDDVNSGS